MNSLVNIGLLLVLGFTLTGCYSGSLVSTLSDTPYTPAGNLRFKVTGIKMEGGDLASAQRYSDFYSSANLTSLATSKRPDVFTREDNGLPITIDLSVSQANEEKMAAYLLSMGLLPLKGSTTQNIQVKVRLAEDAYTPLLSTEEQYQVVHTRSATAYSPIGLASGRSDQNAGKKVRNFSGKLGSKEVGPFFTQEYLQAVINCLAKGDQALLERLHAQWPQLQQQRREESLRRIQELQSK
jgi:hypothetical protein